MILTSNAKKKKKKKDLALTYLTVLLTFAQNHNPSHIKAQNAWSTQGDPVNIPG